MKTMRNFKKSFWLGLVLMCAVVLFPLRRGDAAEKQLFLDFDQSDPVEYIAPIMEISHDKGQLVVAEATILVVDFMIGGHRFATEVTAEAGNPKPFEFFKRGDIVFVTGFKNADGFVFASLLQKLESLKAKPPKDKDPL